MRFVKHVTVSAVLFPLHLHYSMIVSSTVDSNSYSFHYT